MFWHLGWHQTRKRSLTTIGWTAKKIKQRWVSKYTSHVPSREGCTGDSVAGSRTCQTTGGCRSLRMRRPAYSTRCRRAPPAPKTVTERNAVIHISLVGTDTERCSVKEQRTKRREADARTRNKAWLKTHGINPFRLPREISSDSWHLLNKTVGLTMHTVMWNRFPIKNLLVDLNPSPVCRVASWILLCASFNYRKQMKAEPGRLILRKLAAKLELEIIIYSWRHQAAPAKRRFLTLTSLPFRQQVDTAVNFYFTSRVVAFSCEYELCPLAFKTEPFGKR